MPRKPPKLKDWVFMANGTFNNVYISKDGKSVLKIQKNDVNEDEKKIDTPLRSVKLWNEINPGIAEAKVLVTDHFIGWVAPFIEGRGASDEEICNAVIDIFNRTGRIIVDAVSPKNILTTENGQVICVDIGMALKFEDEVDTNDVDKLSLSDEIWTPEFESVYQPYFFESVKIDPQSVEMIKALLFIKQHRPDITNADFLKADRKFTKELAQAYSAAIVENALLVRLKAIPSHTPVATEAHSSKHQQKIQLALTMEQLKIKSPLNFDNLKENCLKELQKYIDSRGRVLPTTDDFQPSVITKIFRNKATTIKKVDVAISLKKKIQESTNVDVLKTIIIGALQIDLENLYHASYKSGFQKTMMTCMRMVQVTEDPANKDNAVSPRRD